MTVAATSPRRFDAIVVGAGIVGLCAAALLSRHHRQVALLAPESVAFKPTPDQLFDPRVYAISGKSRRFLEDIRAWDALPADRVTAVTGMEIWGDDSRGERLALRARDSGVDAITWIVEQQSLLDALDMVARFAPGLTRFNQRMVSMSALDPAAPMPADASSVGGAAVPSVAGSPPSGWRIRTDRGDVLEAPIVIAADGAGSAVRAAALLDFPIEDYNAVGVVGTFRQALPHDGIARQWFLGDSVLALLPLPDQCVSMVWSMDSHHHAAWQRQRLAEWVRHIGAAADGQVADVTGALTPCGDLASYPLRHGVSPLWFADGVVLVGDAAHLVHPLAGQGLNIGIEDVADLAAVIQDGFSAASLRAWQRQRKAGAQPIHWLTHGLNGLFRVDLPGVQWLRNTGMQVVNQIPALKRWLVGQAMR